MRGTLISIDEEKAVVNVRSREIEVLFTQITSLRTANGDVQYNSRISLSDFLKSLESLEDVDMNSGGGTSTPPDENNSGNGGFGSSRPPAMETPDKTDSSTANGGFGTSRPQNNGPVTNESGTTTTVTCANCKKTVSVSAKAGDQCPHCGILWDDSPASVELARVNATPSVQSGAGTSAGGHSSNPMNANSGGNSNTGNGASNAVPSNTVPPAITAGPAPPVTVGNLPVAAKAFIFIFFIGVAYYMFFYRR